ncbi:hypothetical protein [Clostridium manihotivorum]|uniref:Uncharacterized protein n=1 Tax=Clostridium manihotivorum TaxID=2320868 RepID=A0A410DWQ0_9CLOT|nr:hypothetical protein [Clostridium manihotivorum]QAA33461.1 hypothetical protein C1I91_18415 [Clostridium manihotivorum]
MRDIIRKYLNYFSAIILFLFSIAIFYFYTIMVDDPVINITYGEFVFFIFLNLVYLGLELILNYMNEAKSTFLQLNALGVALMALLWIRELVDIIEFNRFHIYATTDVLIAIVVAFAILLRYSIRYKKFKIS